jgi:hypothetical protein
MRYSEVIQIPAPLEDVKQVRDSSTEAAAGTDVETFVVSDRMADQLRQVVLPNLRFDSPGNNKGLFVVGTYGTGKTHLMSVIAGVAEFPELLPRLRRQDLATELQPISGVFQVIRFDIGASAMSLRDIVCTELTKGLGERGVEFIFPPIEQVTNTKDSFVEMMAAFEAVHPDQGLLFVLDEMLDYLRGRKDAELIQDLAFLREVGETCKNTRFRMIGGLQESLFDNPRFAGAADAIRRVKDRFDQVRIARDDVAFVVRERLLPKSSAQRDLIRNHLSQFTPLYDGMAERLEDFVDLYPIHPAYLATFEQLTLVEKREVLRTVEAEIRRLVDHEIPTDSSGLVCIDSYRARLVDDASARMVPEVQEVLDKSDVVRMKIQSALPDKQYVATAIRIIDALAIHRLTTSDIHARIGLTVEELRDQLCLLPPGLPRRDAVFLRTTIETILSKTLVAVSGQFLGRNEENGQVYLDVAKDIDYDQLIAQRADSLDAAKLDSAYYLAMEETLGLRDDPYIAGYRIWQYELPWPLKNSARTGYLFMGAPNERSTAQPPRDFYLYFLQPYDLPKFIDEERLDEVFLRLEGFDDEFTSNLRRYAGAVELAKESTQDRRPIYAQKAQDARQAMVAWLRVNLPSAMSITYRGEKRSVAEWLVEAQGLRASVSDQIRSVCSHVLAPYFDSRFPGYPVFGVEITPDNLSDGVRSALVHLADTSKATTASRKILASLELLGGEDRIRADGQYAQSLADQLAAAGGRVLNRSEVLPEREPGLRSWGPWHLEPGWCVVVAAALTHMGKAELVYPVGKIDALALDRLSKMQLDELVEFSHIAPPTELPTARLAAAAELLGLPPGSVPATGISAALVSDFGTRATELLTRVVEVDGHLADGIELWGEQLIDLVSERQARITALRTLAEDIKARNSIGKLNKFSLDDEAISNARAGKPELTRLELLQKSTSKLEAVCGYLREAVACFGEEHPISTDAGSLREEIITALRSSEISTAQISSLAARGEELRRQFITAAKDYYRHRFLDAAGDQLKQQILESEYWKSLTKLATVTLLQGGQFASLRADLADIKTLMEIDDTALRKSVKLDSHTPGPVSGASAAANLEQIQVRASQMLESWRETLVSNLNDPELEEQKSLLLAGEKTMISSFLQSRQFPSPMTDAFVSAADKVFRRFTIKAVDATDLLQHLFPGDAAASPDELRSRFEEFISNSTENTDADRVRLMISTRSATND